MENKVIFKAGGEKAAVQFCPRTKFVRASAAGQEMNVLKGGKVVFRAGDGRARSCQQKRAPQREVVKYATPQNLSRGELAWKICDDMALLGKSYDVLAAQNKENSETFLSMKSELAFAHASMQKIAQNLARQPRRGSIEMSKFSDFCDGLSRTTLLQRQIMADLRQLQRMAENFSTQIVIIYLSIQAQNQTTQNIFATVCSDS